MTATQTPCTPDTDRFLRSVAVPDPPASPHGRKCYWDDTVQEAVGELRRRLASSREAVVTLALLTIVKVETTRMRHGRPVSGTQVSNVREEDDWRDPLPTLAPLPSMKLKPKATAAPCSPGLAAGDAGGIESIPQTVEPTTPVAATPQPTPDAVPPTTPIVAKPPPGWPTLAESRCNVALGESDPPGQTKTPTPAGSRSESLSARATHPDKPTPPPVILQAPTTEAEIEEIRRVAAEVYRDPAAAEERLRKTIVRGAYSPLPPPSTKPPPKPESESGPLVPSPSG